MRRSICVLLACVLLLALPAAAFAATKTATGSTYYSNVPGFNFTLTDTYSASTSTTWKITGISFRAHLTAEWVWLPIPGGAVPFCNDYGTIGPLTVTMKSGGSTVYTGSGGSTKTIDAGGTGTWSWSTNVTTKVNGTYGTASAKWTQKVLPFAPFPSLSSKDPCVVSTSTY